MWTNFYYNLSARVWLIQRPGFYPGLQKKVYSDGSNSFNSRIQRNKFLNVDKTILPVQIIECENLLFQTFPKIYKHVYLNAIKQTESGSLACATPPMRELLRSSLGSNSATLFFFSFSFSLIGGTHK